MVTFSCILVTHCLHCHYKERLNSLGIICIGGTIPHNFLFEFSDVDVLDVVLYLLVRLIF